VVTRLPRLVVAAPASGHGKTTVATGLMAALRAAGHAVSGHKVGPDYIDPGYHALATGRPGRNLDPHLVGEERVVPLLLHGAAGADLAVVEGVMGLYDGQLGTDGFASTAHVAALTRTPVLLVVDVSHASRTVAATVHGLRTWRPDVDVVGVVLNKVGSPRHSAEVRAALASGPTADLPVLGELSRDDGVRAPSRHLGLVPAAEREEARSQVMRLADQVGARLDLGEIVRLARAAPDLPGTPWEPAGVVQWQTVVGGASGRPFATGLPRAARPRIAVAAGRAFTFRYPETTELLHAAGAEVVEVDPLRDPRLPPGTSGLYLGGGFPEVHAAELGANQPLLDDVRRAVAGGLPTVAECAGLLYLCRTVRGPEGEPVPMVGALDAVAAMTGRLTLAYRTGTAPADDLLSMTGETATGHEFHRTALSAPPTGAPAWMLATPDGPLPAGIATPSLHASYLHVHWAGHPHLAARFVRAAASHATPRAWVGAVP